MCPRDREELFHPLPAIGEPFIATHLQQAHDVLVESAYAPLRRSEPGQEVSTAPPQPGEVSGLSKSQAEALLDLFEATGYELCQLSFVEGEGFSVRPRSPT